MCACGLYGVCMCVCVCVCVCVVCVVCMCGVCVCEYVVCVCACRFIFYNQSQPLREPIPINVMHNVMCVHVLHAYTQRVQKQFFEITLDIKKDRGTRTITISATLEMSKKKPMIYTPRNIDKSVYTYFQTY